MNKEDIIEIVSGGCRGTDLLAEDMLKKITFI
jgi:hypothetical protein